MATTPVETGLWSKRRSRCCAGSVSAAGKRCAPGQGDAGICTEAAAGLRAAGTPRPTLARRLNKSVRAVCRLWWRGPARVADAQVMN